MQFFKSDGEQINVIFENNVDVKSSKTGQSKHFAAGKQTVTCEEYEEFNLKPYREVNLYFALDSFFKGQGNNLERIEHKKEYPVSLKSIQEKERPWEFLTDGCIWDNMFVLPLSVLVCGSGIASQARRYNTFIWEYFMARDVLFNKCKGQGLTAIDGIVKDGIVERDLQDLINKRKEILKNVYPGCDVSKMDDKELLFGVELNGDVVHGLGTYVNLEDVRRINRAYENQVYEQIVKNRPELVSLLGGSFLYEKLILDKSDNIFKQNFFTAFKTGNFGDYCGIDYISYLKPLMEDMSTNICGPLWSLIRTHKDSLISVSDAINNVLASFEKLKEQSNEDETIDKNPDTKNMKIGDLTGKTEIDLKLLKNELDKLKGLAKNAQESGFPPALQIDLTNIKDKKLENITEQDLKKLLENISSVRNKKSSKILDDVLYDFVKFGYKNMFESESKIVQSNAYVFICGCINKMSPEYLYQKLFPGKESKDKNYIMDIYNNLYPQKDNGYYVYEGGDLGIDRYLNISAAHITNFYSGHRGDQHFLMFDTIAKKLKYTKERKESFKALTRFVLNRRLEYRGYHMRYEEGVRYFTSFDPNFIRDNLNDPAVKACLRRTVFLASINDNPYKPFLKQIAKYDRDFNGGLSEKDYLLKFIELAYDDKREDDEREVQNLAENRAGGI